MPYDLSRTRLADYDVTWNAYFFGAVDKVTPDLKLTTKPIKVGSFGDRVLGKRIVGLEGTVKVEAREIDLAAMRALMPWYDATATPTLPLTPVALNKDLYDYAHVLRLHPIDKPGDTTEDLVFSKAVPTITPMQRDGMKDDLMLVTFEFFPNRASLPDMVYGYIGT